MPVEELRLITEVTERPASEDRGSRVSLAGQAYESLLNAILRGILKPGEVISVVRLSGRLGISRTPVHEAIRQLVADGLVIQEPNRRPTIAEFSGEAIHDIFEMRRILEGEAAGNAATRMEWPVLKGLRDEIDELRGCMNERGWFDRWLDHDVEFHAQIARASGSKRLADDILRYKLLHHGLMALCADEQDLARAVDEHDRILQALENRDPDAARRAMVSHIRAWQAYYGRKITER